MQFIEVLCALLALACAVGAEFDYDNQAKWYDQWEACGGDHQSPIELSTKDAEVDYSIPSLRFELYHIPFSKAAVVENNGHTISLTFPKPVGYTPESWQLFDTLSPNIQGGPLSRRYVAESLHFHWGSKDGHGSEHVIDSKRFAMEMHIVSRNTKYPTLGQALEHKDGAAVLGVMFSVQSNLTDDFAGLKGITDLLPEVADVGPLLNLSSLKLSDLLGDLNRNEFFTYPGSLTTPACNEAVTWIVFPQAIPISPQQMSAFHGLSDGKGRSLENNYRMLQAKGDRKIRLRKKLSIVDSVVEQPGFWDLLNNV